MSYNTKLGLMSFFATLLVAGMFYYLGFQFGADHQFNTDKGLLQNSLEELDQKNDQECQKRADTIFDACEEAIKEECSAKDITPPEML